MILSRWLSVNAHYLIFRRFLLALHNINNLFGEAQLSLASSFWENARQIIRSQFFKEFLHARTDTGRKNTSSSNRS